MQDIQLDVKKGDNVASTSIKLNIKRQTNILVTDSQKITANTNMIKCNYVSNSSKLVINNVKTEDYYIRSLKAT